MKKNKIWLFIVVIGLLFILIGFLIHLTNRYRLILILIGLILQIIGMCFNSKHKIILIPVLLVCYGFTLIFIDYLCALEFNKLPVFSYRQTISSNSKIYYGLFYRVWDCDITDSQIYIDNFYKSEYYCQSSTLSSIDVNDFLLHYEKKYKDYKNSYVKITGKISKIQGVKYLEMAAYEYEVDSLNGYVTFDENVKLRFIFNSSNKDLANYNLYDNITIIGKVSDLLEETDDTYTISLKDSKIVDSSLYDDYELVVDTKEDCTDETTLLYSSTDKNYYQVCINTFEVKYSEDAIYSLEYILQDNKMDLSSLYDKAQSYNEYEDGGSIMYYYNNFNILVCNTLIGSKDVYFGNKNLDYSTDLCKIEQEVLETDEVVE